MSSATRKSIKKLKHRIYEIDDKYEYKKEAALDIINDYKRNLSRMKEDYLELKPVFTESAERKFKTLKNRLKVDLCGYKKETAAQKVTMLFSNYHLQGMYHLNNLEGVAEVLRHVPVPMSEKRQQKLEDKKKKELEKKELEQKEQEKVAWEPKVVTTVCEQWKERTEVNIEKAEEKEEQEKQRRRARGKKAFEEDFSDDEEEEKKKEEEDSSEKSEEDDSDDDQEDEDWYFLVNKIMRKAGWVVKKMRKVLKVINTLLSEKISIKEAIAKKKKEEDEKAKKEKEKKEDDDEEEVTVSPPPAKERKVGM